MWVQTIIAHRPGVVAKLGDCVLFISACLLRTALAKEQSSGQKLSPIWALAQKKSKKYHLALISDFQWLSPLISISNDSHLSSSVASLCPQQHQQLQAGWRLFPPEENSWVTGNDQYEYIYTRVFFYWAAQNMTKYWKINLGINVFFFFWGGGEGG